ncbi:MAG TPA: Rieske 2Fe-2S domain-containing protein [Usitatibacteraceae bacterium]|nr:Rieske 2Fe-2S domain-containing protein [Usitatibacteraceae bacterium]
MARPPRLICEASALAEGGAGVRFDWPPAGGQGKGFAVRHDGKARAYVNRCPHLGTELDWQPGQFFDESGLYLVCSTHGAIFEPSGGRCVAGPCRGSRLQAIAVEEREGRILVRDENTDSVSRSDFPQCP